MDGWETRRRRTPGHDWCIVRLGLPGVIHGVVVDTSFFRGNFPESCSVEAATVTGMPTPEDLASEKKMKWRDILDRSPLRGDSRNEFPIDGSPTATHLRLSIYPDGGVARLRVHGEPVFASGMHRPGSEIGVELGLNTRSAGLVHDAIRAHGKTPRAERLRLACIDLLVGFGTRQARLPALLARVNDVSSLPEQQAGCHPPLS